MAAANPVRRILGEIAKIEGVQGALLVSKDGFIIDAVIPSAEINKDAVAAMVTSMFDAATNFSREFGLGDLSLMTIEYKNSMALGAPIGDAYLVVLAESGATIGRIRYEIQKQKDRLKAAL
ncbi:MAG: roadblock/LC7 domain-containing protein [Desulfurococcales archaeon]|nr:roadblock/LC7 domain-containing protein [Desulfurococcales archaeon]